jgi:hypothetical protein
MVNPDDTSEGAIGETDFDVLKYEIDELHKHYLQTQNPIYVFCAISACFKHATRKEIFSSTNNNSPNYDAILREQSLSAMRLPSWVMDYLTISAFRVTTLARGNDPRTMPEFSANDETYKRWKETYVSADVSAASLPVNLGFTRDGWNAFKEYATRDSDEVIADELDVAAERLNGRNQAADALAERYGFADARSIKRIVQRVRKRRRE